MIACRFAIFSRAAALLAALLCLAPAARAARRCAEPHGRHGCFSRINAAIAASSAGDIIQILPGRYVENVVVDKALTLEGAAIDGDDDGDSDRDDGAVIYPAVSNPDCSPGSLCGGAASVIILVRSDGVTIRGLTLNGDNPALLSGVVRGGHDIDARIGIITDHLNGAFTGLTVEHVEVRNVYTRGMQMSTGGTFSFRYNQISNVQGDGLAIALFNSGGQGVMEHNVVDHANDALSANHSRGTRFAGNVVTHSQSGVHTDNAGDGGGSTPDLIEDNRISDCEPASNPSATALWSFVSYLGPVFRNNTSRGCTVGLGVYGIGVAAGAPTFSGNRVLGSGAAGTVGALVTTADLGFGTFDATAQFSGNHIERFETGLLVHQDAGRTGKASATSLCLRRNGTGVATQGPGTASVHQSAFSDSARFGADATAGGPIDATSSFWGAKSGPRPPGAGDAIAGAVTANPFLTALPTGLACPGGHEHDDD